LSRNLLFETTVWPADLKAWLAVLALDVGPAGAAFYLWDHAVKHGDIRALAARRATRRRSSRPAC